MSNTDQPGGSGTGRTVPNMQQNVVIDANSQAAAAQLAQQILANTNVGCTNLTAFSLRKSGM